MRLRKYDVIGLKNADGGFSRPKMYVGKSPLGFNIFVNKDGVEHIDNQKKLIYKGNGIFVNGVEPVMNLNLWGKDDINNYPEFLLIRNKIRNKLKGLTEDKSLRDAFV